MEKMDKPRIAQVLGVEVGERFDLPAPNRYYRDCYVTADARVFTGAQKMGSGGLCWLYEHPDCIIRQPSFTEEEVADAKALIRILGATGIERTEYGGNLCAVIEENAKYVVIDQGLFPSLRPGQAVSLSAITGECP